MANNIDLELKFRCCNAENRKSINLGLIYPASEFVPIYEIAIIIYPGIGFG